MKSPNARPTRRSAPPLRCLPLKPRTGGKVRAGLSAPPRDSETEPAEGGAAAVGRAGAGRRARAARQTHPATVPVPRPGAGGRAGGHRRQGLRAHGGQWAPVVTAPAPLLGMWLSSEKLRSASLRTKKGHGDARFKEGPRGAGARVPKDKGTPPASLTLTLNLVRPPLLVPTSQPSPARHRGRLSEKQGHQTAPPLRGRGPRLL